MILLICDNNKIERGAFLYVQEYTTVKERDLVRVDDFISSIEMLYYRLSDNTD